MSAQDPDAKEFIAFLKVAVVPILVLKGFIMYFGLNYSRYPGEGYGYGLALALGVSVTTALVFVWRQTRGKF